METWLALALVVVVLAAGGVAGVMRMQMVLDRSLPDDAERRRRHRHRGRVLAVTSIAMVAALAGLWTIASPNDAWWVLPLALVLVAALVVLLRALRRRERAAQG
ncbi:hypothetical protein, partial [Burkholderia cenocepacia]|uniref:hypothetical protein n=1 Tax=Burkholderia cenocepacia TaxID=95486 RepID=UPI0038CC0D02